MPIALREIWDGFVSWLPSGRRLPDARWRRRHRAILWVLWPHVPALWLLGVGTDHPPAHVTAETGLLAVGAILASSPWLSRRLRTLAAVMTLVGCSSVLVHFTGGLIESHFHFFAVVAFITLYQEWVPFAVAFSYVVGHHALVGVLQPTAVYNHDAAWSRPVLWAVIHGGYVALASLANLAAWRLAEVERQNAERVLDATGDGLYGMDTSGRISFINPVLCELLGRDRATLEGQDQHHALGHRLSTGAAVDPADCAICASVDSDVPLLRGEAVVQGSDGAALPVEYVARPLRDRGRRDGTVITLRDLRERHALEARLREQALCDPLTGLANRALLADHVRLGLAGLERGNRRLGLLFCDLNRFKVLNDSLGHTAGDEVLRLVAARLRSLVRRGDTVARFGGDEFVVLCQDVRDDAELRALAERILTAVREPLVLEGRSVHIGVSVGIRSTGDPDEHPDDLIRDADAALYHAKSAGTDVAVFDEVLRAETVSRFQTETELHAAVDRGQLRLHYQPVVALDRGTFAAEALVRWQHPERGLLPPGEFVPVAEETGLIVRIGAWVLDEACGQLVRWDAMLPPAHRPPYISVNVSGRQLTHPGWPEEVEMTLARHGVAPHRLCVEVTESAVVRELRTAAGALQRVHDLGVRVALDDFGTGYSSLNYLRQLPVDLIKIDRSFVTGLSDNPSNRSLVTGIVGLARALGLDTVAEGVENAEDLVAVRAIGCQTAQGFLWGRPGSAEAFLRLPRALADETTTAPRIRGLRHS